MSFPFNPDDGIIIVGAEIEGPSGTAFAQLALDTGATNTLINMTALVSMGYDPALARGRLQITTASGVAYAGRIMTRKITVLGQVRTDFSVLSYTLPPSAGIDGVLGLDFLRRYALTINFPAGQITLK